MAALPSRLKATKRGSGDTEDGRCEGRQVCRQKALAEIRAEVMQRTSRPLIRREAAVVRYLVSPTRGGGVYLRQTRYRTLPSSPP